MKIVLQPEISINVVGYTTPILTDNPIEKTVTAKIDLLAINGERYDYPTVTLWKNQEYDQIGQWTDNDVTQKLNALLEL